MTNFDVTMAKFNRVASAACEDTHAPVAKHLQLIADSRELIAKIDKLLDRDRIFYGSSKPPAASAPAKPDYSPRQRGPFDRGGNLKSP